MEIPLKQYSKVRKACLCHPYELFGKDKTKKQGLDVQKISLIFILKNNYQSKLNQFKNISGNRQFIQALIIQRKLQI